MFLDTQLSLAPTPVSPPIGRKVGRFVIILLDFHSLSASEPSQSVVFCGGRHGGGQGGQQMAYMVADKKIIGRHFVGHGGRHVKKQVYKF